MDNLIERTVKIDSLPIGTGSALGACIRALYLTASRKLCIVGVSVSLQDNKARNFTILMCWMMQALPWSAILFCI